MTRSNPAEELQKCVIGVDIFKVVLSKTRIHELVKQVLHCRLRMAVHSLEILEQLFHFFLLEGVPMIQTSHPLQKMTHALLVPPSRQSSRQQKREEKHHYANSMRIQSDTGNHRDPILWILH